MSAPPHSTAAPTAVDVARPRGHIAALDGVRGLAIALVIARHCALAMSPAGPADMAFRDVAGIGWIGVDLFFVLSGFLITRILADARGRPRYLRNFAIRRALRILPLYVAFLAGLLLLGPHVLPDVPAVRQELAVLRLEQAWYWTFLVNVQAALGHPRPLNTAHFWSLAVEEQFYLVWPVVVLLVPPRRLGRACLALVAGSLLLRLATLGLPNGVVAANVLTPMRLDGFALGALVAVLARGEADAAGLRRAAWWLALGGGLVLLGIAGLTERLDANDPLTFTLGFSAIAALFAGLVAHVIAAPRSATARLLATRPLRTLGKYSYALYVLHYPLIWFFGPGRLVRVTPTVGNSAIPAQVVYTAAVTLVSLAGAWASWHLLERHMLRLKDRLAPPPSPASPAATPPAARRVA